MHWIEQINFYIIFMKYFDRNLEENSMYDSYSMSHPEWQEISTVVPERLTHFRYPQNPENVSIFPEKKFNYEKWPKFDQKMVKNGLIIS